MSKIKTTGSKYLDFREAEITFVHLDDIKISFGVSLLHGTFVFCGAYCHEEDQYSRKHARQLIHTRMSTIGGPYVAATATSTVQKMETIGRVQILNELIDNISYNVERRVRYLNIPESKLNDLMDELYVQWFDAVQKEKRRNANRY